MKKKKKKGRWRKKYGRELERNRWKDGEIGQKGW